MKKIKNILMFALLVSFVSSCDDAVDIVQDGELPYNETFETVKDMQQFLDGAVYGGVTNSSEIAFTSVFTDEVGIGPSNGGQEVDLHRFQLNASSSYPGSIWLQHYSVINRVNRLLEGAEAVTPVFDDSDPDNIIDEVPAYNDILAQARAIRAYSYLQLLSYFSTDMADDSALGVMLLDFVPELTDKLPRVANSEIFALMEADLLFASANIIAQTPVSYKYTSKTFVDAIYARMYLYRKNYPLAKQYAQAVVSGSGLQLSTRTVYPTIWTDAAGGETIFAVSRPIANTWEDIAGTWYFNTTSATGGCFLDMGRNLYNLFPADNPINGSTINATDIRKPVIIDITRQEQSNYASAPNYVMGDILPINKYPGKGNTPLRNDLKLFRLSEMYFILAECAVAEGQLPVAAGYLKNVRDRRFATPQALPVYANATAAWADILLERRKELCFEGFRYLDIKRLGVLANQSIDRHPTDDAVKSSPTTISNTDYRFTLPIPQAEISANGTIQQNPNY